MTIKAGDIAIEPIIADVAKQGFSFLKNDYTVQLAHAARAEYHSLFQQFPASSKGFAYADLVKSPIRKKNISSSTGVGEPYAQVMQSTYFHESYPNPVILELFQLITTLRNQVTGAPADFGRDPVKDGMWNACRIHHYPQGGSFIVGHRDGHFPAILGDRGYIQILYLISEKGVDFQTGGGFIGDLNGNKIDTETAAGMGALVFFDSRILHGVADVDPLEDFSLERKTGRLAALANLYEYRGN
jgi:hypothetical protein